MQVHTYSWFFKFVYRFGNIPVTIFLVLYLIPAAINIDRNIYYVIPFIIILLLIYFLNKHYLELYKIMPYKITADDEKMYCSDFILSKKEFIIYYKNIETLSGGIFDGKLRGVMKVYDGNIKVCIGFFDKIKDAQKLQTLILSKIKKEVYDEMMDRILAKKKQKKDN